MSIKPIVTAVAFAFSASLLALPAASQEVDAEARRDAGADYASAARIRVSTPLDKPKGRAASWRGRLSANDRVDAFKFSPTPAKGQAVMLAVRSQDGPLTIQVIDRRSGDVIATGEKIGDTYGTFFMPETGVLVTIAFEDGTPERAYHAGIIYSSPEEMGIPSEDAATKAFAEAMRRKPTMKSLPDGFSLIVPKDGEADDSDDSERR